MLSDEWLSRYGLLENFNASVTRTGTGTHTGTGTWTTGVTAIALCTSCSRAKNIKNDTSGYLAIRQALEALKYRNYHYYYLNIPFKIISAHETGQ